jgi:hypothetical protein
MALTTPEDAPVVKAAATEFLKLCHHHGLKPEQVIQAAIVVAASGIGQESAKDREYALELVDRFRYSLRSAVLHSYGHTKR